jgi:hypothetical protein
MLIAAGFSVFVFAWCRICTVKSSEVLLILLFAGL